MSEAYSSRPSEILHIEDPYTAWCIDEATFMWGNHVEGSLNDASNKAKSDSQKHAARLRVLTNLLSSKDTEGEAEAPAKGKFRDPASMIAAKKKGGADSG